MKRPMSLAAKSEICSDARANNARVWGPEQEDWKQQWAIFDNIQAILLHRFLALFTFGSIRFTILGTIW